MCTYANLNALCKSPITGRGSHSTAVGARNKKRGPTGLREGTWSKAEGMRTRENYEDTYI